MFTRKAWKVALVFVRQKWKFIIGHLVIALIVAVLPMVWGGDYNAFAGLFALLFMEIGQAKDDVPGSVHSPAKWLKMIKHVFKPVIIVQWLLQGLIIYFLNLIF
jgi:hypothetical protein